MYTDKNYVEKIVSSKFQTTLPHIHTQKKSTKHTLTDSQRKNNY